jgi:hypothetical protein
MKKISLGRILIMNVNIAFFLAASAGLAWAEPEKTAFDVSAVSPSLQDKIQWHGYYEFEYWDQQGSNRTFDAHKLTVWMGVRLNERAYLSSEVEFEHAPKLDDSSGDTGGSGKIKVDSAQLRLNIVDPVTAYMGVFYAPFGIEYYSYPGNKNKLVTRPKAFKSGGVFPGTWSDVGAGFSTVVEGYGELDVFALNGDAKNGGISMDNSNGGNDSKTLGVRFMANRVVEGVNIGASWLSGKWDESGKYDSTRAGAHLRVDGDVMTGADLAPVFIGEYITGSDSGASSVNAGEKKVDGYYVQLSSLVHPLVELAVRYGEYDNDKDVTDNRKTETSAGVALRLFDGVQLKGEYQWNRETGKQKDNDAMILQAVANW